MWLACPLPGVLVAVVDLAFFPCLVAVVAPSLIKAGRLHNLPFPLFLMLLFTANLLFHLEWLGWTAASVQTGILLGIDIVMLLIVIVGGRIVPAFTVNGLRNAGTPVTIASRSEEHTSELQS